MGLRRHWNVLLYSTSGINRVHCTIIYLYVAHSYICSWNNKAQDCWFLGNRSKIPRHVLLAAAPLLQSPAVQRGMPSHSRTWGLFALHGGTELYGDAPCILCRQVGFPRLSRSAPVFMLRWLASGQIAIIQKCVTEENVLHYGFYQYHLNVDQEQAFAQAGLSFWLLF